MDPCSYDNSFFSLHGFKITFGCNGEYFTINPRESFTKSFPSHDVPDLWVLFEVKDVLLHVSVSIRTTESKVNGVVIVGEFVSE
jgi:hypothetical protein